MSLDNQLIAQAIDLVKLQYEELGKSWAHGWSHISRVRTVAQTLAQMVGADPTACVLAALCHDLGALQEKSGGEGRELANTDHALWSVAPTIKILDQLGVSGYEKGAIVAAVANHSFKLYQGKDLVGSVLRDADKADALGPWGTLRCSRHVYKEDLVNTHDMNKLQTDVIEPLANLTRERIKQRTDKLRYLENVTFVLEWDELKMFHHPQIYPIIKNDLAYTRNERLQLLQPELDPLIEASREEPRKRKAYFYHQPIYPQTQIGMNAIQPESLIRPHARSAPESIIHLCGELVYIEFDHNGKVIRKEALNKDNPHIRIPTNKFHTLYATKPDSALGMLVQGPHNPADFRIDANWAPIEDDSNRDWYIGLRD